MVVDLFYNDCSYSVRDNILCYFFVQVRVRLSNGVTGAYTEPIELCSN